LAKNFPPHCLRIAAQRPAGEAFAGTLNEQLKPSAVRPALPLAAKAALVAVMQDTSSAAMTISIINLMAPVLPSKLSRHRRILPYHQSDAHGRLRQIGPVLA
jgi:hypothetical protein